MSGAVIGVIATGLAAPVITGLLLRSRLFRFDAGALRDDDRERILRSYGRLEPFVLLIAAAGVVVFTCLFFKAFIVIHGMLLPSSNGVRYALSMHPVLWFLPALFLAILASGLVVDICLRLRLRDRYTEYRIYDGLKYRINSRRILMVLSSLLVPFIMYFGFLIPQCYYYFSDEGIRLSPFFSTETKEYRYQDIDRIVEERSFKAPGGKIVRKNRYAVDFSGGYSWSSHRTITTLPEGDEKHLMAFISERSGIPVEVVDPYGNQE